MKKVVGRLAQLPILAAVVLTASCARDSILLITFDVAKDESAWYPIDVGDWREGINPLGEPEYYYTLHDATADLQAYLADPATGQMQSSRVIRLESYKVVWQDTALGIPDFRGALDLVVPADPGSGQPVRFTIMVLPANDKREVPALDHLRGAPTPSHPSPFNGQLTTTARIDFLGRELANDDPVSATMHLTAVFADYVDPNNYH
jgi:hypothetical protein